MWSGTEIEVLAAAEEARDGLCGVYFVCILLCFFGGW